MNQEMLCTWLGLPKTAWPPDPWTLVGLPRDERNLAAIEKRVQDRMTTLRGYQLSYPAEATEGMNRLAEAFIALTETCGKPAPCFTRVAPAAVEKPTIVAAGASDDTSISKRTSSDWHAEPPPVRQEVAELPEPMVQEENAAEEVLVARPFAPPSKPIRRGVDPALMRDLAEESNEATSNLATLVKVIERVDRTRLLLHAWDQLGKQLKGTSKKLSAKENEVFSSRLDLIAQVMQAYPAFLGQPGKPGYRVVVQARLRVPLAMLRAMNEEQREELLYDWQAGRQVLLTHRKYLHRLFKSMRHRSAVGLFLHAVRSIVNDHPLLALTVLVVVLGVIVAAVLAWR